MKAAAWPRAGPQVRLGRRRRLSLMVGACRGREQGRRLLLGEPGADTGGRWAPVLGGWELTLA